MCRPEFDSRYPHQNTLIKMESGENQNPTLDTLKKVAKALDVSVDKLIK
ncbi:MAG TPA: hypothetical protein DEF00_02735 [Candidatus Taylorbacteria bacterium]|nr:hypothetical protein [Candidatus Taylorbacteria bacterium]